MESVIMKAQLINGENQKLSAIGKKFLKVIVRVCILLTSELVISSYLQRQEHYSIVGSFWTLPIYNYRQNWRFEILNSECLHEGYSLLQKETT